MFLQSLFFAESSPVRNGERDAAGKWGGGWERAVYGEMLTQKEAPERARSTFSQKA